MALKIAGLVASRRFDWHDLVVVRRLGWLEYTVYPVFKIFQMSQIHSPRGPNRRDHHMLPAKIELVTYYNCNCFVRKIGYAFPP